MMKRLLEHHTMTGSLLALLFFLVLVPIATDVWDRYNSRPIPTSEFFEVRSVAITSAMEGYRHTVRVDRSINRDFVADWVVTVRKFTDNGLQMFCSRRGRNDYRAGTPPPTRNLRWWMDIPPNVECPRMEPGQYIVSFLWLVHLPGGDREVRADSNVFEVWPLEGSR
jgi:hypothetical protein